MNKLKLKIFISIIVLTTMLSSIVLYSNYQKNLNLKKYTVNLQDSIRYKLSQAQSSFETGDAESAIKLVDEIIFSITDTDTEIRNNLTSDIDETTAWYYGYKASILLNCAHCNNGYERALSAINNAIEILETDPFNTDPKYRYKGGFEKFGLGIRLAEAYSLKSEILIRLNMLDEAQKNAIESTKIDPNYSGGYKALSWVYYELGEYDKAKDSIDTALSLDNEDPRSHNLKRLIEQSQIGQVVNQTQDLTRTEDINVIFQTKFSEINSHYNNGIEWSNHSLNFLSPFFCSSDRAPDKQTFSGGIEHFETAIIGIKQLMNNQNLATSQRQQLERLEYLSKEHIALINEDYNACYDYFINRDYDKFSEALEYHNKMMSKLNNTD